MIRFLVAMDLIVNIQLKSLCVMLKSFKYVNSLCFSIRRISSFLFF